MSGQFTSSQLKIKRAYRHIDELKGVIERFLHTDFCKISLHTDGDSNQLLKVTSIAAPPAEVALVVGDIVHNLRCALDHAIVQILGERGNRETFPVGKERHNVEAHSTYRLIKKAMPDLAALILETIMPHDGTNGGFLWAGTKLDNLDKHNILVLITSVQRVSGFGMKNEDRKVFLINVTATVGEHGVLNVASIPAPIEITGNPKASAQILFGKGQPLEGKPILESLAQMAQVTSKTIETLELFWFGKSGEGPPVVGEQTPV